MKYGKRFNGCCKQVSLPVRGAWIEMGANFCIRGRKRRRSPCGERGLKYCPRFPCKKNLLSLPVRGAWIEITSYIMRAIWILSLPVRGAWIEIIT